MTVSVLVAVYNAEPYLKECMDSLLAQTYRDMEILCVDDCSTDGSSALLADYARQDARISVTRLSENSGQAHARNVALSMAHGDLIAFLDSDDTMAPDAIEQAVKVFEQHPKTGCVLLKVVNCLPDGSRQDYPMSDFGCMGGYEAFVKSLTWKVHGWYVARTELYRRFPFDETCKSYSDDNTTRLHYYYSEEVRTCDGVYYYRLNPSSVTHAPSIRRFDYLRANESMKRMLYQLKVPDDILDIYETVRWRVVVDSYMFFYWNRQRLNNEDRLKALQEIRRVWFTIETKRVESQLKHHFGYMPLRNSSITNQTVPWLSNICWFLFRVQEEVYFTLRKILKNR